MASPSALSSSFELFGPLTQSLTHGNDSSLTTLDAHVNVSNFVAEATFMNPYERAQKGWDYGFVFRSTGSNQQYRIWVDSDQNWYLRLLTGPESSTDVKHGMLNNLDVSVPGSNKLAVVVVDSAAYFFVNDTYIDTLDVSVRKDGPIESVLLNWPNSPMTAKTALDAWIAREAIPFTIDSPVSIDGAVDRILGSLGDSVELLGIGEALHGSEEILLVRNRLFQLAWRRLRSRSPLALHSLGLS